MSYASPSDLLSRYDARILGDLAEDDGNRVTPSGLLSDANVAVCLEDASSMINAASLIGLRYTHAELAALTGTDKSLLLRLCCDLAFVYLAQRRGVKPPMYDESYTRSDDLLTRLRNGELIFNVPADVSASTVTDQFPSAATYQSVNLLRTAASPLFPVRRKQTPASGGNSGPY